MKVILTIMLAILLNACASSGYGNMPSYSTSVNIPIGYGTIYQSIYANTYGIQSSTYTSLYDILGTSANASFNIDW